MLTPGGCDIPRSRTACRKIKKLLQLLTSNFSLSTRGKVFLTYVRNPLLHANEY